MSPSSFELYQHLRPDTVLYETRAGACALHRLYAEVPQIHHRHMHLRWWSRRRGCLHRIGDRDTFIGHLQTKNIHTLVHFLAGLTNQSPIALIQDTYSGGKCYPTTIGGGVNPEPSGGGFYKKRDTASDVTSYSEYSTRTSHSPAVRSECSTSTAQATHTVTSHYT